MAGSYSPKRINYGCYAIAECNKAPIVGAISASISTAIDPVNVIIPGQQSPSLTYSILPNLELNYVEYLSKFKSIADEAGISSFASFDILVGDDINSSTGSGNAFLKEPKSAIRCTNVTLDSITYNLEVQGFFTVERKFTCWRKAKCTPGPGLMAIQSGSVLLRQNFDESGSSLPSILSGTKLQKITITMNLNRQIIGEFSHRKPYASIVEFPIETTCVFESLITDLDSVAQSVNNIKACNTEELPPEKLKITICHPQLGNSSLDISKAYLTNIDYNGADANSDSNLSLSVTYVSYEPPSPNIEPFLLFSDNPNTDDCACN